MVGKGDAWKRVMVVIAKQCPYCDQMSYSAADREGWICPYCNRDITHVPVQPAVPVKGPGPSKKHGQGEKPE